MNPSCSKSPTGAHHWILESLPRGGIYYGTCKYCLRGRKFDAKVPYWIDGSGKPTAIVGRTDWSVTG